MKLLSIFIFISFGFSATADNIQPNPTAEDLWNNVHLVHVTNYLANHTVVPGSLMEFPSTYAPIRSIYDNPEIDHEFPFHLEPRGPNRFAIIDIREVNAKIRITSHWTVFEPVRNFVLENSDKVITDWAGATIAIIEPAKYFKGQLFGGFHRDMMVIGPHELSHEAYIFAPVEMKDRIKRDNPNFRGKYWFYGKNVKNAQHAVELFNRPAPTEFQRDTMGKRDEHEAFLDQVFERRWNMRWPKPAAKQDAFELALSLFALSSGEAEGSSREAHQYMLETMERLGKEGSPDLAPTAQIFVDAFEALPATGHIYLNGSLRRSRDVFASWQDEGLFWGSHNSSGFRELEKLLSETLDDISRFRLSREITNAYRKILIDQKLKVLSPELRTCPEAVDAVSFIYKQTNVEPKPCQISRQTFINNRAKIFQKLGHIRAITSHMSQKTKDYLDGYIGELNRRLEEQRAFCKY